ncbi:MAG: helix-turn-helix transcriptional regulator, partial [Gaiellaceae bacterium]
GALGGLLRHGQVGDVQEGSPTVHGLTVGAELHLDARAEQPLGAVAGAADPVLVAVVTAQAGRGVPGLDRERSILSAVASGLTTAAISRELWVSQHTVKFHLTNIYRKLGVANRTEAARYAFEHDLAETPRGRAVERTAR